MQIIFIKISNYRNLDGVEFELDKQCNFIVGENNFGKTNLLHLLDVLFNGKAFKEDDFNDQDKSIEVDVSLYLDDSELGKFEDYFDETDCNLIHVRAIQESSEDYLKYFQKDTDSLIDRMSIKTLNLIKYDSMRTPSFELNFEKKKGVGKFLDKIIRVKLDSIEETEGDYINKEKVLHLISGINETLDKIKIMKDFSIKAHFEEKIATFLGNVISLRNSDGRYLKEAGYGVQYFLIVILYVLERIMWLNESSKRWDKCIVQRKDGKVGLPLVIAFDEPEIHLHPFMQRSLVKHLKNIIENKDSDFLVLLKDLFEIDFLLGQLIFVSHSPNIILDDYKEIIRFYQDEDGIKVASGSSVELKPRIEKHLLMQFPIIKEAFFSRFVIVVEGESEAGAFSGFARSLNVDFDDLGISVIKAHGNGAVPWLMYLLNEFGIKSLGIIDKDQGKQLDDISRNADLQYLKDDIWATDYLDFENEIVEVVTEDSEEQILSGLIQGYDSKGKDRVLLKKALEKRNKKYELEIDKIDNLKLSELEEDDVLWDLYCLTWLSINKSIILGRFIGDVLPANLIPKIYKKVINEAEKRVRE